MSQEDRVAANKGIVRRMLDAWNRRKEAHLVRDLVSPHTITRFAKPVEFPTDADHAPNETETALPQQAFPDQYFEEEIVLSEDDMVFVGWKVTGTNEGTLYGNNPTHKKVEVYGADAMRVDDDNKIAEHWPFYSKPRVHALASLDLLNDQTQNRLRTTSLLGRGKPSGIVRKPR